MRRGKVIRLAWVVGFSALTRGTRVIAKVLLELEFERVNLLHAAVTNHDWVTIRSKPKPASKCILRLRKAFEAYNLFHFPIRYTDANNSWRASVAVSHINILTIRR